jgi:hypothetical protein
MVDDGPIFREITRLFLWRALWCDHTSLKKMARPFMVVRTACRNQIVVRRTITLEGVAEDMRDIAKKMLNAYSRSKTIIADKFVASLSIEEKERVYKLRGLVDQEKVKAIVADSEISVVKRIQQAAAVESEKAEKYKAELEAVKREFSEKEKAEQERMAREKVLRAAEEARLKEAELKLSELKAAAEASQSQAAAAATVETETTPLIMPDEEEDGRGRELTSPASSGQLMDRDDMRHSWDAELGKVTEVDPILGSLLYRMGNRRLYLMDVPTLYNIPVWEKQRVYRKERAKNIADGIKLKINQLGNEPNLYEVMNNSKICPPKKNTHTHTNTPCKITSFLVLV